MAEGPDIDIHGISESKKYFCYKCTSEIEPELPVSIFYHSVPKSVSLSSRHGMITECCMSAFAFTRIYTNKELNAIQVTRLYFFLQDFTCSRCHSGFIEEMSEYVLDFLSHSITP